MSLLTRENGHESLHRIEEVATHRLILLHDVQVPPSIFELPNCRNEHLRKDYLEATEQTSTFSFLTTGVEQCVIDFLKNKEPELLG